MFCSSQLKPVTLQEEARKSHLNQTSRVKLLAMHTLPWHIFPWHPDIQAKKKASISIKATTQTNLEGCLFSYLFIKQNNNILRVLSHMD